MIVRFKKLHPRAKLPTYAKPGDAGADVCAVESVRLRYGEPVVIPFGFAIELPDGYEAQIRPRSSLSKAGVFVSLGTVDAGYRGVVGATLTLVRPGADFEIFIGDRVAQMVIAPVTHATFEEAEELSASERGTGGFGSTGR